MNEKTRELLENAKKALEKSNNLLNTGTGEIFRHKELIQSIDEALAETAQEPVGEMYREHGSGTTKVKWFGLGVSAGTKLYTHPVPTKEWVGLNDEEINVLKLLQVSEAVIRAIEQTLKEKNSV